VDFKPGDIVRGELNSTYHMPNRPALRHHRDEGGGDAVSAGRAVVQTAEYDYAWNMQVEEEIMRRMEQGGRGKFETAPGGNIEHIQCNQTDPNKEVDGERASVKAPHPFLTDPAVRQALNLLVDRASVQEEIYGRGGQATANFLNSPPKYVSKNTRWEFNVDKANQVLDAAGGGSAAPTVFEPRATRSLKMVYQTSINAPRQKTQAIVKQAAAKAGIELELKSVTRVGLLLLRRRQPRHLRAIFDRPADGHDDAGVAGSADVHGSSSRRGRVAAKDNKYQGRNITRWRNEEYDQALPRGRTELEPREAGGALVRMNDMVIQNVVVIPVIFATRCRRCPVACAGSRDQALGQTTPRTLFNWFKV